MKTIQQFPHEAFLKENNIDSKALPEMLYKRIEGFEELKGDLEHTTDEDKEKLLNKLETLSHELDEDLEDYFVDHLENNDREEDEQQEPVQEEPVLEKEPEVQEQEPEMQEEEVQPEITPEPLEESAPKPQEEEVQPEPTPEPLEEPAPELQEEIHEPEPVKEPTDEEILEAMLADKKHNVLPLELKKKGFKTSLNGKRILVGKFCLRRGKYDTCYKIILKSE